MIPTGLRAIWMLRGAERMLWCGLHTPPGGWVPVTARLSRRFYETFGDEIANELVNWFNDVDATYRADLRETNEVNYARFDAKLEQRIAELGAALRTDMAALRVELIRWMFLFWVGQVATTAGIVFGALALMRQ